MSQDEGKSSLLNDLLCFWAGIWVGWLGAWVWYT